MENANPKIINPIVLRICNYPVLILIVRSWLLTFKVCGKMSLLNPAPGFLKYPGRTLNYKTIERKIEVIFNNKIVASSNRFILLEEENYAPVMYVPRDGLFFEFMESTKYSTYCPFKGKASYWNIKVCDKNAENAVWSYSDPFDEAVIIKNYFAFYSDKVGTIKAY